MKLQDLKDIASISYRDNPYHNWLHGEYVGDTMAILENTRAITPGIVGGYFHDADHNGVADSPNDEERAARIMHDSLINKGFDRDFIKSAQTSIMGTVFSERGNLTLPEQKLIADSDVSLIGRDYMDFIRISAGLLLEVAPKDIKITDERILQFFSEDQQGFFNFLTGITGDENNPFLTETAKNLFPNFRKNKDTMNQDLEENPNRLISTVREVEKSTAVINFRKK